MLSLLLRGDVGCTSSQKPSTAHLNQSEATYPFQFNVTRHNIVNLFITYISTWLPFNHDKTRPGLGSAHGAKVQFTTSLRLAMHRQPWFFRILRIGLGLMFLVHFVHQVSIVSVCLVTFFFKAQNEARLRVQAQPMTFLIGMDFDVGGAGTYQKSH